MGSMCEETVVTWTCIYREPCSRFSSWTSSDLTRGLTHFLILTWQVELDWTRCYVSMETPSGGMGRHGLGSLSSTYRSEVIREPRRGGGPGRL